MVNPQELFRSLEQSDRLLWQKFRAEIQSAYMRAHATILGFENFVADDSHFLDAIDHKLSDLFARAGRQMPLTLPTSTAIVAAQPPELQQAIREAEKRSYDPEPSAGVGVVVVGPAEPPERN